MATRGMHHDPRYGTDRSGGEFGAAYHLEMLRDQERVGRCAEAIRGASDPAGTFCELGAGTGVFSLFAARLFKKVVAVERDAKLLPIIRDAVRKSGLVNLTVRHEDALECVTPSFLRSVDVLFCEMMSTWLMVEPQIIVMNKVSRSLRGRSIITIPGKVVNLLEVGNYDYDIRGITLPAALPQFTGVNAPRILSASTVANVVDLTVVNSESVKSSVQVKMLAGGIANCVRLSSIVQLSRVVSFYSTDTLMPQLIVPLNKSIEVQEGDTLDVAFEYLYRNTLESAQFSAARRKA